MTKIFKDAINIFVKAVSIIVVLQPLSVLAETKYSTDWVLSANEWEVGQNGNRILQMPVLQSLMQSWIRYEQVNDARHIELRYPGGEEGELWVQELSDWLVAMGLSSKNIFMVPGSGAIDKIKLTLVR